MDATGAGDAGTVLDSGATHHVNGSFHLFSNLSSLCPPLKLNLASSDGSMMATHSGHLKIINGDGSLMIPRVLYSPEMTGTLLSLGQLIDSGFKPSFLRFTKQRHSPEFFFHFSRCKIHQSLLAHLSFLLAPQHSVYQISFKFQFSFHEFSFV
jgi:hypothetical protein